MPPAFRARQIAFAALAVGCAALAAVYVLQARRELPSAPSAAAVTLDRLAAPSVAFISKALDAFGVIAAIDGSSGKRRVSAFRCDRIYFSGGRGVCLAADRGVFTTYKAVFFDSALGAVQTVPLPGIPSRTRVSPDGAWASTTVFVSGHSYAPGSFSTETSLWSPADGRRIATMDQFTILRDGKEIRAVDFNFWGITFAADGRRFYATLATDGVPYLIEGDLETRVARVLLARAECPSLSPDGSRLVFKRLSGARGWELVLLDLRSMRETRLVDEPRNVDDQVEWLDDKRILYAVSDAPGSSTPGENIWMLPVDGGAPSVYAQRASSPVVLR